MQDVGAATAASRDVKRLFGDVKTAATPGGEEDGEDGDTDTQDHVDMAEVVAAHGDVAPGAEDPTGVAERTGGEHDQRHEENRAGDSRAWPC